MKVFSLSKLIFVLFASSLAIGSLAACSVQKLSVENRPPVVRDGVVVFDTEHGTLTPESVSMFFWPHGLSEDEARKLVKLVNAASLEKDQLTAVYVKKYKEKVALEEAFWDSQCAETYAENTKEIGESDVEWVTEWKTIEPVTEIGQPTQKDDPSWPDYERYLAYLREVKAQKACIENQAAREVIITWSRGYLERQAELVKIIFQAIDPATYPEQINYKSVAAEGSILVFKPLEGGTQVDITLAGFMGAPQTLTSVDDPTTVDDDQKLIRDVVYDSKSKVLKFKVPELTPGGVPTGAEYVFELERTPNFLGRARFAGDVRLMNKGQILRNGSFVIVGCLTDESSGSKCGF